ncbi:MAG: restriction endonuclease subunit S, partial [bacterium]|nr:restriction endonuclease subunit S [bacterium]
MTYKNTHLEDLLDSTVSGYWGEDYATTKSRNLCQVIRNGDVGKNGCIDQNDLPRRWFSNSELAKALVRKGDSILVSSGAYTGNVGRLSDSSKNRLPVIASNFVRRLRSKEGVRPDWLYHLLRSGDIQAQVPAYVGGSAMPNLQPDFYKYCRVPVCPSPQVQDIIIRIINSIDSTIDQAETLLAKQQRIKTGLIHDLLTRGLDAQGRLRDPSNYPIVSTRVGNIPAEWNLSTVGEECYQVCVGIVIRPTQYYSETGPIALLSL